MNWAEIERLTDLVKQLPLAERLSRQQLNEVLVWLRYDVGPAQ
jgi:hypothetical protein